MTLPRIETTEEKRGEDTILHPVLVNDGEEYAREEFVRPLVMEIPTGAPADQVRFLVNGYSSFSGSGSFHLGESEIDSRVPWMRSFHRNLNIPKQKRPGDLTSSLFGVLTMPGEEALLIGFLGPQEYFTQVRTSMQPGMVWLWAQVQLENEMIPRGTRVKLPSVFVARGPAWRVLDRYAKALGESWQVKPRQVPPGWCSWYYYSTRIDEGACDRNLKEAQGLKWPVKVFQVDDGYQSELGDWLVANEKFPSGLEAFAKKTRDAGMIPGIWLAPFLAKADSKVVKEHPRWLLHGWQGQKVGLWNPNWGPFSLTYALDATHPDMLEHLRLVFTRLREMGFGYFKLDFLFAATLPGSTADQTQGSYRALRQGLQVIREAVGDAYLLGCGCPMEAGIGLVDSMRVGNDMTPYWSNFVDRWIGGGFEQLSTRNCVRNTLVRAPFNQRVFHSDPDCLMTIGLTATERRTVAQVNALSGGTLFVSDDLSAMDDERRSVIDLAFKLAEEVHAVPRTFAAPDFMEQRIPELQLALGADDALLGVYNFNERPLSKKVRLAEFIPWPRFTVDGKLHEGGELTTDEIEPHGSRLYRIRPAAGT